MKRRFKYSDYNITPSTKCVSCGETARELRKQYGDNIFDDSQFSEKLDGWICFPCRESFESMCNGTVIIYNPKENLAEKYVVMEHEDEVFSADINDIEKLENPKFDCLDYAKSPIQFEWHGMGYRGYYEPKGEGWKVLHSDCILSGSEDAEHLKEFDVDVKQMLWELGYEFAVCFGTTSNLFSCGYDIMIKKDQEQDIIKQMKLYASLMQLREKYRNPDRFRMTAITGKSDDFDDKDRLLAEASKRLHDGEDFETVKKDILERA